MHSGSGRTSSVNMLEGSLWKSVLIYSLPLMMSQLLQVLFNIADVAVVGKFASAEALGSVGSTTILVSLFTGLLIGIGSGVNVRVAQHIGAKDKEKTEQTVHTSFLVCLISGLIVTAVCIAGARWILTALHTKDDLIDGALLYFRIYSMGMPALALFNFGNAVLSAKGDTKRPLMYLTIAGVLNVILNFFFVLGCHMAADGVAWASIISQYVSAVLVLLHLKKQNDECRLVPKKIRFYKGIGWSVVSLGLPAGVQNAIFATANLFVQSGVNSFSSVMVEGNAAAANADALIYDVMGAFYTACSSFMGQNWGANKHKRILKSYFVCLTYSFAIAAIMGFGLVAGGKIFLSVFSNSPEVIDAGMQRIRIMGWCYCVSAFMDCTIAASRGIGKSLLPTIIVIIGSCVFRVVWIYTVFAYFHTIASLYLLYIFSWVITSVAEIAYFAVSYRKTVCSR